MKKLYYSCGIGFRTFDLEEAKKYCQHKNFDLIHIINIANKHELFNKTCYEMSIR